MTLRASGGGLFACGAVSGLLFGCTGHAVAEAPPECVRVLRLPLYLHADALTCRDALTVDVSWNLLHHSEMNADAFASAG